MYDTLTKSYDSVENYHGHGHGHGHGHASEHGGHYGYGPGGLGWYGWPVYPPYYEPIYYTKPEIIVENEKKQPTEIIVHQQPRNDTNLLYAGVGGLVVLVFLLIMVKVLFGKNN